MFENVDYTFYSDTLGRETIPDEKAFNEYKLLNILYIKSLVVDGLIIEKEANGIDSAVCMMIEEDYKANLTQSGENALKTSEAIGSYNYSINTKKADMLEEKDSKSTAEKKYKWLSLYCHILGGIK